MGAFTSVAEPEDTNTSFTVAMEQTLNTFTAHYPSSAHFQKRISSSEWSEFVNAMSDKFLLYMRVFLGCFVVCFLSFIIGAALSPIAFVLWLFLFPVMFAAMLMHQSEISKVVDMYNEALFRPRGVVMEYHKKRGKHDSAKLRVCLGYPATSESVATLGVKNNAHCPPALLERFAAANSEFSRSAYALSSASGPEGCVGGAGGAGPGSVMQVTATLLCVQCSLACLRRALHSWSSDIKMSILQLIHFLSIIGCRPAQSLKWGCSTSFLCRPTVKDSQ